MSSKPPTYTKPVLSRVYDKSGQLLGYSAEPEKLYEYGNLGLPKTNYQITCDEVTGIWNCTCPATKPCKHIKAAQELNEIRLGVAKVEVVVEEPVVVTKVEEVAPVGDMSVAEHLLEEEMKDYEVELRYEGIADLRMRIKNAGLSVTDRSKEPLIQALLTHRRVHLQTLVIVSSLSDDSAKVDEIVTEECHEIVCSECGQHGLCCPECEAEAQQVEHDEHPESVLLDVDLSPFDVEPVLSEEIVPVEEEEFSEEVAPVWVEEAIAQQEPTKAQVIMSVRYGLNTLADFDPDHAGTLNGVGPYAVDSEFVHDLANRETLTPKQIVTAARVLKKYNNTQLGGVIPPVAVVQKVLGLTPKAKSATPQASVHSNVDYSKKGALTRNEGFSLLKR